VLVACLTPALGRGMLLGVDKYRVADPDDPVVAVALDCAATEAPTAEGVCAPVGVTTCGDSGLLEPDGDGGCRSRVAVCEGISKFSAGAPRECTNTVCEATEPQAAFVPPGGTSRFVRPGATGGDGSLARPFGSLEEALRDAEGAGEPVAHLSLFPGEHAGPLVLTRPTILVGAGARAECTSITSDDPTVPVISIEPGAADSVLSRLTIRGGAGVAIRHAPGARISGSSVVGSEGPGISIEDVPSDAPASVSGVKVEGSRGAGIVIHGSRATLTDVHVRAPRPNPWGAEGRGIVIAPSRFAHPDSVTSNAPQGMFSTSPGSDVTLARVVVEGSAGAGIWVEGSRATIEDAVVRDTAVEGVTGHGSGVFVQNRLAGNIAASLELRRAVIERSAEAGLRVQNAAAIARDVTIRDSGAEPCRGRGIRARFLPMFPAEPAPPLEIAHVLVEGAGETGTLLEGVPAAVSRSLIRRVEGCGDELGDGIAVYGTAVPSAVQLDTVRVTGARGAPVVRFGDQAAVTAQGGLYDGCAPASSEGGAAAIVGPPAGACFCGGRVERCAESTRPASRPWPASRAAEPIRGRSARTTARTRRSRAPFPRWATW
jgi:hypothetical protein